MKAILNQSMLIYPVATIGCMGIMIIIDFILGAEAEHLNAWVIVNRLFGNETTLGDSLAIKHFGLAGATFLMIALNALFGAVIIHISRFIAEFFQK